MLCCDEKFYLICDARYTGTAKNVVPKEFEVIEYPTDLKSLQKKLTSSVCFYEDSITVAKLRFLKKTFPSFSWAQKKGGLDSLRRVKNQTEIKSIAQAQARVDSLIIPFLSENLRQGSSEVALQKKLDRLLTHDFEFEVSFPTQVSFGENSAIPHHHSGDRLLKLGDNVLIDCGIRIGGYCSDVTRNYTFGSPSSGYLEKYKELLGIQQQTLQRFKAGEKVSKIDHFCRDLMGKNAQFYTHSLGHGVGLEIHEMPRISHKSSDKLLEQEVVTCEPGYYFPGEFGIRIEDLLVVTKGAPQILSSITKDLLSFDEAGDVTVLVKAR